jgi:hypothetical protein
LCEEQSIPIYDLKELLTKFYSEEGGLTVYDGSEAPTFDKSHTFDKFHTDLVADENKMTINAYYD